MSHQILLNSKVVKSQIKSEITKFKPGSTVSVHYKIVEENKERIQIFTGIVISRHGGNSLDATFTVLKNATAGIKVHRTFPLHSPLVLKIELVSDLQRARRSKLYFAKDLKDPAKTVRTKSLTENHILKKNKKIKNLDSKTENLDSKAVKDSKSKTSTKTSKNVKNIKK
jgi:large subunit ribosomal protein L19